jgi:hypothetical protein
MNDDWITQAKEWRKEHREHVKKLAGAALHSIAPCGSDRFHPELWKGAHWCWLYGAEAGRIDLD